jgi:hypothetical protein
MTVNDADRFRLVGTYKTPRFRYGSAVWCEVRGEITVCRITEAPIPWPVGNSFALKALRVLPELLLASPGRSR